MTFAPGRHGERVELEEELPLEPLLTGAGDDPAAATPQAQAAPTSGEHVSPADPGVYPKIELHVHLEGTVRPHTLLEIARRNGYPLPATEPAELARLYEFRDFEHFIDVWVLTTNALRSEADFRSVALDYAAEAAAHGAVYLEAIFSPIERVHRGVDWDAIFTGYCDGAREAYERFGVEVRLTPEITRDATIEDGFDLVRYATKYRDRGVVGVGLGGLEAAYPPEPWAPVFAGLADQGLGSVPHAGEVAGPASVRGALHALRADRIRHGIRAVEDPGLLAELRDREIVLDVCPISNVRTRAVSSLATHPLPVLASHGVRCSISTDDPAMFDTDLTREYEVAASFGLAPRTFFEAGLGGALCDAATRMRLADLGARYPWPTPPDRMPGAGGRSPENVPSASAD